MVLTIEIKGMRGTLRLFRQIAEKSPVAAGEIVKEAGKRMVNYARARVPVESGKLRRSIRRRTVLNRRIPYAKVWCGEGLPYAHAVESGAKPHPITYKIGSIGAKLSTGWRTASTFEYEPPYITRLHPGNKPTWFWRKARKKVEREFPEIIRLGWNKHFRRELSI